MGLEVSNILGEFEKTKDKNAVTVANGEFLVDGFDGVTNPGLLAFSREDVEDAQERGEDIDRPLQERINDYTPITTNVDTRLVAISNAISTLKSEIVTLVANSIGTSDPTPSCGTLTGLCTAYTGGIGTCLAVYGTCFHDSFQIRNWNAASRSYVALEQESYSTATLTSSNVGVGTFNILTADAGSGAGTTVTLTSSCGNYAAVTSKYAEIDTLRAEANSLISKINTVKEQRCDLELDRWAILYSNNVNSTKSTKLDSTADDLESGTLAPYA